MDVSWLLATPILIREIRLHATYHNCSSSMPLSVRTTQSIHLQCNTAKNEKPPSLCAVDSGYMDTDVTKNRSGLTKNGISASYGRVMDVKRGVARAVCARSAQDGIVVPSNSRSNVFTTHGVDNIDSTAQGNFSMSEFARYTLSVTSHCSHENPGVKRSSIIHNPSDTSIPKLPDSYVIQPSVELAQTDVFSPKVNEARDGANDAVD